MVVSGELREGVGEGKAHKELFFLPSSNPKRIHSSSTSIAQRGIVRTRTGARLSLVTKMQLKTVNGGETVFEAGDKADAMYVVKEGLLTVSTSGRPETRLSEGETFGEAALFAAKGVRSSTVRAQIQSVLWELTADAYKTVPLHHSTRSVATKWMIRAKTKQSSTSTAALSGAHDGIVVDTVA